MKVHSTFLAALTQHCNTIKSVYMERERKKSVTNSREKTLVKLCSVFDLARCSALALISPWNGKKPSKKNQTLWQFDTESIEYSSSEMVSNELALFRCLIKRSIAMFVVARVGVFQPTFLSFPRSLSNCPFSRLIRTDSIFVDRC